MPVSAGPGAIVPPFAGDINDLISRVTFIIRPFVLITFLMMMIWGGYIRMTAAGNAEQEERSTKILTAAIIGFIIIAVAPILLSIAQQVIGIPTII